MIWAVLLWACSDYTLEQPTADREAIPDIALEATGLNFGRVPVGERVLQPARIENRGDAALYLSEVFTEGDAFDLDEAPPETIAPGESVEVLLRYDATTGADLGWLVVLSDDPDTPEVRVSLTGEALFGELVVSPDPYDFGALWPGCERETTLTLSNEGGATLSIESASHDGEGFSFWMDEALPLSLDPGASTTATLLFTAEGAGGRDGALEVITDLPEPTEASQTASVGLWAEVTETFKQPGEYQETDILFYLDRSCSMDDDTENLAGNFAQFIDTLDGYVADYQIVAVTRDDGCYNGSRITPDTDDPASAFSSAVWGSKGDLTEAGLTIAMNAVNASQDGDCNEGFLREGAKLSLILISDEADQSDRDWSYYVDAIQDAAPGAVFSAVAGPVPSGCATADAGDGYAEAVEATGGVFLSICDADWGSHVEELAERSVDQVTDTFTLADEPDESTLFVAVDGAPRDDWVWDADRNAVVFDEPPEGGATVEVRYYPTLGCD